MANQLLNLHQLVDNVTTPDNRIIVPSVRDIIAMFELDDFNEYACALHQKKKNLHTKNNGHINPNVLNPIPKDRDYDIILCFRFLARKKKIMTMPIPPLTGHYRHRSGSDELQASHHSVDSSKSNSVQNSSHSLLNESVFGLALLSLADTTQDFINDRDQSIPSYNNSGTTNNMLDDKFALNMLLFTGQDFAGNDKDMSLNAAFDNKIRFESEGLIEIELGTQEEMENAIRSNIGYCVSKALNVIYINQGWNLLYASFHLIPKSMILWVLNSSYKCKLPFLDNISNSMSIFSSHRSHDHSVLFQKHMKSFFTQSYIYFEEQNIDHHIIIADMSLRSMDISSLVDLTPPTISIPVSSRSSSHTVPTSIAHNNGNGSRVCDEGASQDKFAIHIQISSLSDDDIIHPTGRNKFVTIELVEQSEYHSFRVEKGYNEGADPKRVIDCLVEVILYSISTTVSNEMSSCV